MSLPSRLRAVVGEMALLMTIVASARGIVVVVMLLVRTSLGLTRSLHLFVLAIRVAALAPRTIRVPIIIGARVIATSLVVRMPASPTVTVMEAASGGAVHLGQRGWGCRHMGAQLGIHFCHKLSEVVEALSSIQRAAGLRDLGEVLCV